MYSLIRDMKKDTFILAFFFLALLAVSCSKHSVSEYEGDPIEFRVSNVDISAEVKSVLDQDAVNKGTILVYAEKGGTAVSGLDDDEIKREETGRWLPATSLEWEPGDYVFHGYTWSGPDGAISISNHGKTIIVNQPDSYRPDDMVDYLLSYVFRANANAARPVVTLALEHAMSLVEIKIVKSPSIIDARLVSLKISGFYRTATMSCPSPASYGTSETNLWSMSYGDGNNRNGEYTLTSFEESIPSSDDSGSDGTAMRFMAVPQILSSYAVLTVEYEVNEKSSVGDSDNYQRHSESFELYDYSPAEWASGHRIVYELTVDTGIHLQGSIVPWKNVDMIEGTVLPEL